MKLGAGPLILVLVVVVALLATPLAADAQQAGRSVRIGYLSPRAALRIWTRSFGRRCVSWADRRTKPRDRASLGGDRLTEFATELARMKVDVIFAPVSQAAEAARKATRTVPIVFATVGDPVGSGLAATLGRPGGNATGLSSLPGLDFVGKQLQLLKDAQAAAASLRVRVQPLEVSAPTGFESAFDALTRERADVFLVLADPMFFVQRARLADLAARSRVPALYGLREHTEAGGLMSYGASFPDLYRRAALYVDKILKGSGARAERRLPIAMMAPLEIPTSAL